MRYRLAWRFRFRRLGQAGTVLDSVGIVVLGESTVLSILLSGVGIHSHERYNNILDRRWCLDACHAAFAQGGRRDADPICFRACRVLQANVLAPGRACARDEGGDGLVVAQTDDRDTISSSDAYVAGKRGRRQPGWLGDCRGTRHNFVGIVEAVDTAHPLVRAFSGRLLRLGACCGSECFHLADILHHASTFQGPVIRPMLPVWTL